MSRPSCQRLVIACLSLVLVVCALPAAAAQPAATASRPVVERVVAWLHGWLGAVLVGSAEKTDQQPIFTRLGTYIDPHG